MIMNSSSDDNDIILILENTRVLIEKKTCMRWSYCISNYREEV